MFKPTAEEIKEASSGGRVQFKRNENVEFTVLEVDEKKEDNGDTTYIVKVMIDNTDNKGRKHNIWCNTGKKGGRSQLLGMLRCFMTEDQILAGVNPAIPLVGKRMQCVPKYIGEYVYWFDWKALGGAPQVSGQGFTPDASDIPF